MSSAPMLTVVPEPSAAERMMRLFGGARANGYRPEMTAPAADGKVRPVEVCKWTRRPTVALWEKHVRGEVGIGIIAPGDDGKVRFGAIDVDDYTVSPASIAGKIKKLPLIPVKTKSGGAHLLLFAEEPADPELMERALRSLAGRLGLKLKEAGGDTEVLVRSNVWMPHCGSARPGVKASGSEMTVAEFLHHAEEARQPAAAIAELAATRPRATEEPSEADGAAHAESLLARYCAELAGMPDSAGRNDYLNRALFQMGRMVGAGHIERELVESELRRAADAAGMDKVKTEQMIRRRNGPLARGTSEPPPDIGGRDDGSYRPLLVRVADVPMRPVDWLWRGRIARGALSIIAGHPGVSKSMMTIDLAARVTTARPWPCGEGVAPLGSVVIVTSEDAVGHTIHPRLAAAGADATRVHVLRGMARADGGRRGFDLTLDVPALEVAVREVGDVALIIVDTITAYMGKPGKVDSYRASDVRSMLEPLQDMAERQNAAVIGINHLTKGGGNEALMRFLGSVGMVAAGRSAYLVARDEDNPKRRLFLPAKNNLGPDHAGLAFALVEKPTGNDVVPYAFAVEWESETVTITADEALAARAEKTDGRRSEAAETAKRVIAEMLRDGPADARAIEKRCRELGISKKSMRTAKAALGAQSGRRGKEGWEWWLPGQEQDDLPMGRGE